MEASQAETLSRILADMERRLATKHDMTALRGEMAEMKADLTWRMFAIVVVVNTILGTALALFGPFT